MTVKHPPRHGFTLIEVFAVVAIVLFLVGLMLPAMQNVRNTARKTGCQSNLSQLAIAFQNYAMTFDVLPPGTVNATGPIVNKPTAGAYHVSWTVAILPYIELSHVYNHFDFRYGVYHKRNRFIRAHSSGLYTCPSAGSYAGCHAGRETPIDADNDGCLFLNSSVRFEDVTDGCTDTLLLGDTASAGGVGGWMSGTRDTLRNTGLPPNVPNPVVAPGGTSVEDFSGRAGLDSLGLDEDIDPAKAPPGLLAVGGFGSNHFGGANFAFCDGAVRFVSQDIDPPVYRNLGSRNDGALPGKF